MKRLKGETLEEFHKRVPEDDREDGIEGEAESRSADENSIADAIRTGFADLKKDVVDGARSAIDEASKAQRGELGKIIDAAASGRIVSRNQPTDPLYRTLHKDEPYLKEVRTADYDYWNARYLMAFWTADHQGMREIDGKLMELSGRTRATTATVGVLDASDDTAITDGTAGSLLPQEFAAPILVKRDVRAKMAPLCQNFVMTGPTLRVPTIDNVAASTRSEGATQTSLIPDSQSVMLIAHNIAVLVTLTKEIMADSPFNIVGLYQDLAGRGIAKQEDIQILTTNGTSPNFTGALVGAAIAEPTATQLDWPALTKLYRAVAEPDRDGAVWLGATGVLTLLDNLEDGGGHPILFNPSGTPSSIGDETGNEGTIKRRRVFEVPVPADILLFGDCKGYAFARRAGLTIERAPVVAAGKVEILIEERADGALIDAGRLKQSEGLTT